MISFRTLTGRLPCARWFAGIASGVAGLFAVMLLLALLVGPTRAIADSGCPTVATGYASGSGIVGDPWLIATPEELQLLRDSPADWTGSVRLAADLDMGGCIWSSSLGGLMTPWTGVLDGDGHVVSGLTIDLQGGSGVSYGGFISNLGTGGSISNLGFEGDVTVTSTATYSGSVAVGGLVGRSGASIITGSFFSGSVTATLGVTPDPTDPMDPEDAQGSVYVGGLVGQSQSDISNSYSQGSVQANVTATATGSGRAIVDAIVGGLVGFSISSRTLSYVYSTSAVDASATATGGGTQSAATREGGFAGNLGPGTVVAGAVWDTTTSGQAIGVSVNPTSGVTGLTTAAMTTFASFGPSGQNWSITDGYSNSTTWSMCPNHNSGYPFLSDFADSSVCGSPTPTPSPTVRPLPPVPQLERAGAPQSVTAAPGNASATVEWLPPQSSGTFPITEYRAVAYPGGQSCTNPTTSCVVTGLANGTAYTFTVQAFTALGPGDLSAPSNEIIPTDPPEPVLVISGMRDGSRISVTGASQHIGPGSEVVPWTRRGAGEFVSGVRLASVGEDGGFTWTRRASPRTTWEVYFTWMGMRSNTLSYLLVR